MSQEKRRKGLDNSKEPVRSDEVKTLIFRSRQWIGQQIYTVFRYLIIHFLFVISYKVAFHTPLHQKRALNEDIRLTFALTCTTIVIELCIQDFIQIRAIAFVIITQIYERFIYLEVLSRNWPTQVKYDAVIRAKGSFFIGQRHDEVFLCYRYSVKSAITVHNLV